jgi:DNA-directed RNA polymerase subunit RPC12/RpoP
MINESFTCDHCSKEVSKHPSGSARNHCPYCLYSKHVDDVKPGDRLATCHGLMRPIGLDYRKGKGEVIIHECEKCGKKIVNIPAPDDELLEFVRERNKKLTST